MRTTRSKLTILAVATAFTLVVAGPAWADATVSLDPARLPITASEYAPNPAGDRVGLSTCGIAPSAASDRDMWIFRVTGALAPDPEPSATPEPTTTSDSAATSEPTTTSDSAATPEPTTTSDSAATSEPTATSEPAIAAEPLPTSGPVLVALSATFGDAETITVDRASDGRDGGIVGDSAWIAVPAGSILTAASATIAADAGTLELVGACPARPVATADPLAGLLPSATSTTPPSTSARPTRASPQTLPVAGTDVVSIAALGAGLVLTGILLILAHGRRPKMADDPEEDDIRQPVIMIRRS